MNIKDISLESMKKTKQLNKKPVAIEAYWDGDTRGWFLVLAAILDEPSQWHPRYTEYDILILRYEESIRLFDGIVPSLPEAEIGAYIGNLISAQLDVPFYFPARQEQNDAYPRWWDKKAQ